MNREIEGLNRLAQSLVRGYPFIASVRYDASIARLTLTCRSTRGAAEEPVELKREWSPTAGDYADLDRYVREHIGEFLRLWIGGAYGPHDARDHQNERRRERRSFIRALLPGAH
jgi:hypothetical protein